jgi:hypothetical protein
VVDGASTLTARFAVFIRLVVVLDVNENAP